MRHLIYAAASNTKIDFQLFPPHSLCMEKRDDEEIEKKKSIRVEPPGTTQAEPNTAEFESIVEKR